MEQTPNKPRRRGIPVVDARHRATIPADAMRAAGLLPGDRLVARAEGRGRVVLERLSDPVEEFFGCLAGVYEGFDLDTLRGEWP